MTVILIFAKELTPFCGILGPFWRKHGPIRIPNSAFAKRRPKWHQYGSLVKPSVIGVRMPETGTAQYWINAEGTVYFWHKLSFSLIFQHWGVIDRHLAEEFVLPLALPLLYMTQVKQRKHVIAWVGGLSWSSWDRQKIWNKSSRVQK